MEKLAIQNVFVLHVKKGYEERKKFMEDQFQKHEIPFEYMLDGDLTDLTPDIIEKYFAGEMDNIQKPATSCAFKHLLVYEQILQRKIDYALIFEDDVQLSDNFNQLFNESLKEIKQIEDGFFVSYEDTTLEFVPKEQLEKGKLLYPATRGRCAGAYLIDYQTAKIIMDYVNKHKCHLPIDWMHNFLVEEKQLFSIYWCHPTIAQQGSHTGKFTSGLSKKKGAFIQQIRWKAKAFWKKTFKN